MVTSNRQSALVQQARDLIDAGAPVGGLGAQGHFNEPPAPEVLFRRLDHLAESGLPVWITEYDCTVPDPALRADALERNLRTIFSHPAVDGLLMWGFWAGSLWSGPDAALVDLDGTINAAGLRFQALLSEWTTHCTLLTGQDGTAACRAFHGIHRVTIRHAGATETRTLEVGPGEDVLISEYVIPTGTITCQACDGDLDGDGRVDGRDLAALLSAWGSESTMGDLDGDGDTDGADVAIVLGAWGSCD